MDGNSTQFKSLIKNGGMRIMAIYVITGMYNRNRAHVKEQLLEAGHEVFNIDYKNGDYCADLSTKEGERRNCRCHW